ncbi:MAG TPA: ribonuclease E, partial [Synechococcus sp. UBA8638]|nr:ribonuclease E [Synechococcus sp. UBA8638]
SAVADEPVTVPSPEAEPPSPAGEPEPVTVPMSLDQETVFSWGGFNPALVAPTPPKDMNNVAVRVVGSGEDAPPPSAEENTAQLTGKGSPKPRP